MTRIDFYLNASSKAEVVRKLASKAFHAEKRILIFTRDEVRARELDAYLWTSQQFSFLPHVLCGHRLADKTPVLIGDDPEKLLRPDVLINVAAEIPDWFSRFDRLLEIVTEDPLDKEVARNRFRYFKERGYPLEIHDLKAS
ncbi:MAG: DNA polymerase III subunit chi [Pseudomonadota bacterium]|nr:DNA polymerase III subunit chi [Pseudomonadota bacterium]